MKKFLKIIISFLIIILLTGCGIYSLDGFVVPNDIQFTECVNSLDTVPKIAQYMEDNFIYQVRYTALSPYSMWINEHGDCNDYAAFGVYVAKYHGIETYQVLITYANQMTTHVNAVYKVGELWHITDCWTHYAAFRTIKEAMEFHALYNGRDMKKYKILGD